MPEFQARDDKQQQWKQAVLAGEVELDDIDTDPFNFKARGAPSLPASKEARNMIAGHVGRPDSEAIS